MGALLVLVVMVLPNGVLGGLARLAGPVELRRRPAPAAAPRIVGRLARLAPSRRDRTS